MKVVHIKPKKDITMANIAIVSSVLCALIGFLIGAYSEKIRFDKRYNELAGYYKVKSEVLDYKIRQNDTFKVQLNQLIRTADTLITKAQMAKYK